LGEVPRTALIVDDSVTMREMLTATLRRAGFDVDQGANGQEGLACLDKRAVELVITDLTMPVMDGLTFIKQVRTRARYRSTPILMLTTDSQPTTLQAGKAAGASAWLPKPFNPTRLLAVIGKLLP
jgi:two-component system, chemotaxis family, chemotaxis protein CheY